MRGAFNDLFHCFWRCARKAHIPLVGVCGLGDRLERRVRGARRVASRSPSPAWPSELGIGQVRGARGGRHPASRRCPTRRPTQGFAHMAGRPSSAAYMPIRGHPLGPEPCLDGCLSPPSAALHIDSCHFLSFQVGRCRHVACLVRCAGGVTPLSCALHSPMSQGRGHDLWCRGSCPVSFRATFT